jgi:choline dehydrogenase-like flavoprotein
LTRQQGIKAVKASGESDAWSGPTAGQHICDGTIMGKSAKDSVCNSYGITHQLSNLVIGGQSTFPTCSDANTTFTAHAVSERTSDYLLANWPSLIN